MESVYYSHSSDLSYITVKLEFGLTMDYIAGFMTQGVPSVSVGSALGLAFAIFMNQPKFIVNSVMFYPLQSAFQSNLVVPG